MGILSFLFGKSSNKIEEYIKKDAVILDVRTEAEYDNNHIKGAIFIPLSELKTRINELKILNKPIIAHCKSGGRSEKAMHLLKANGIDAINGGGINTVKSSLKL